MRPMRAMLGLVLGESLSRSPIPRLPPSRISLSDTDNSPGQQRQARLSDADSTAGQEEKEDSQRTSGGNPGGCYLIPR